MRDLSRFPGRPAEAVTSGLDVIAGSEPLIRALFPAARMPGD